MCDHEGGELLAHFLLFSRVMFSARTEEEFSKNKSNNDIMNKK